MFDNLTDFAELIVNNEELLEDYKRFNKLIDDAKAEFGYSEDEAIEYAMLYHTFSPEAAAILLDILLEEDSDNEDN